MYTHRTTEEIEMTATIVRDGYHYVVCMQHGVDAAYSTPTEADAVRRQHEADMVHVVYTVEDVVMSAMTARVKFDQVTVWVADAREHGYAHVEDSNHRFHRLWITDSEVHHYEVV